MLLWRECCMMKWRKSGCTTGSRRTCPEVARRWRQSRLRKRGPRSSKLCRRIPSAHPLMPAGDAQLTPGTPRESQLLPGRSRFRSVVCRVSFWLCSTVLHPNESVLNSCSRTRPTRMDNPTYPYSLHYQPPPDPSTTPNRPLHPH